MEKTEAKKSELDDGIAKMTAKIDQAEQQSKGILTYATKIYTPPPMNIYSV